MTKSLACQQPKMGANSYPPGGWDINKGDQKSPNYSARLVGRKLKIDSRLDLFAATPPSEALRLICSVCANNLGGRRPYRIMTVRQRAYFPLENGDPCTSRSPSHCNFFKKKLFMTVLRDDITATGPEDFFELVTGGHGSKVRDHHQYAWSQQAHGERGSRFESNTEMDRLWCYVRTRPAPCRNCQGI